MKNFLSNEYASSVSFADKADPFIKQRLLALVLRYDDGKRGPFRVIPHPLANLPSQSPVDYTN
jgi:hypothetical protein